MPSVQRNKELRFRPDIEGLRALAVCLVVAFHLGIDRALARYDFHLLQGGFIGVDVFFVISGFLIGSVLLSELSSTGTISLRSFYAKRARRLLPLAAATVLLTLVMVMVFTPSVDWEEAGWDSIASSLFLSNMRFALRAGSYLGGELDRSPFLHFWSLNIEEQFYLLLPGCFLLMKWAGTRWRIFERHGLVILTLVITVGSFFASVRDVATGSPWAYFGLHSRAWELGVGVLLAQFSHRWMGLPARLANVLGWIGLVLIVGSFVFLSRAVPFPGFTALPAVLGTAAVLVAGGSPAVGRVTSLLSLRPVMFVGRLSYAWYLTHWPFVVLAGPATWALDRPSASIIVAAGALSFFAAMAMHYFIEAKTRHSATLVKGWRPVGLILLCTVPLVALAFGMTRSENLDQTASTPKGARADRVRVSDGCAQDFHGDDLTPCFFGSPSGAREMVVIGDSHAAHLVPALDIVARRKGWRGVLFTKASCPPVDVRRTLRAYRREYTECARWRTKIMAELRDNPVAVVVLGRFGGYTDELIDSRGQPVSAERVSAEWEAATSRTLDALAPLGARVILVRDIPQAGFDVPRCIDQKGSCSFSRTKQAYLDQPLTDGELAAAAGRSWVTVVDPTEMVCPKEQCDTRSESGTIKYRDANHLTASFARELSSSIEEWFVGVN